MWELIYTEHSHLTQLAVVINVREQEVLLIIVDKCFVLGFCEESGVHTVD